MNKLLALLVLFAVGAHAEVTGSCPKPLPVVHKHHKHVTPLPLCTCVAEEPRVIFAPPPEPDIEPIPLSVYPYYIPIAFDEAPPVEDWGPTFFWDYGAVGGHSPPAPVHVSSLPPGPGGWRGIGPPQTTRAPEIDPAGGIGAFLLLAGGLAVIRGWRA